MTSTYKIKTKFPGKTITLEEEDGDKEGGRKVSDELSELHVVVETEKYKDLSDSERIIKSPGDAGVSKTQYEHVVQYRMLFALLLQ